jgi:hypothetical protein
VNKALFATHSALAEVEMNLHLPIFDLDTMQHAFWVILVGSDA